MNHFFLVGESYQDRAGTYKVLSIDRDRIVYEYLDGSRHEGDAEIKWRTHKNILSEQVRSSSARPSQPTRSDAEGGFFTHAEAFPIIANAIETYSRSNEQYMTHDKIVEAVMKDPKGEVILERRSDKTKLWPAGVMVAWFSKVFTDGTSEWGNRFEREKIRGAWAYRVRR